MADSVDGLVIEIESSASSVAGQLDILTNRLSALKTAVSGSTPIKTFSKNYQDLVRVINTTQIDTVQLEAFRAFGQVLNGLNSVKVSGTVAKNITSLNTAVNGLNLEGLANVTQYTSTLSQLSEIKISATLPKRLNELAEFGQKIQGQNFSSLQQFTSALAQLGTLANVDASAIKALSTQTKNFGNTARSASTRGRTFNTVLANIRVRTLALVRATQMITRVVTKSLTVYGDYIETLNLFKQAMGDAAGEAYEFGEKAQNLLGIDLTQWMKAQGVLNSLAVGFGVSSDRAAIMSKNLTQLAYDISSFYNIDVDTAIEKVRSGFSGQIRPVRDLGYDLSQARLEAIALSMGIDESVKSMTQAEKSQLRYIALMTQLTHVQGDLARTLDSPINQMRILQAQLNQMYREIGLTLLPILNKILPYLNAILRVIKMIASEIAAMFGYVLPTLSGSADWSSSVSMGAEDLEEDLEDATGAAEKLKNTLASFDQINLITSKSGGSGSGGGTTEISGSGFDFALPEYDFLGDAAENKAQQIAEGMMKKLRPFVDFLKETIQWTINHTDLIKQGLELIAAVTIGKKLYDSLHNAVKWFTELNGIVAGLGLVTIGVQLSYLGGKDMAADSWLSGVLKSTIGAAIAGYGGYILLGPTGIVLGIGLSILTTLIGYSDAKEQEYLQSLDDIFFAIREGRQSVEDFNAGWDEFIDGFANPNLSEQLGILKSLDDDVDTMNEKVGELQMAYLSSNMTATAYASSISVLYTQMADTIIKKSDEASEAIRTALNGELGEFLQRTGISIERVDELMDKADQSIKTAIQDIRDQMEGLIEKYNDAGMSAEDFNDQMQVLYDQLGEYGAGMSETQAIVDEFTKSHNGLINFTGWDDLIGTVQKVKSDYQAACKQMDEDNAQLIDAMEFKLKGLSGSERDEWQNIINTTKTYMESQKEELTKGYEDTLKRIEETGYVNWLDVYDTKGIEGALAEYKQGVGKFNDEMDLAYKDINKTREKNAMYYSDWLASLSAEDSEMWRTNHETVKGWLKRMGATNKDWEALIDEQEGKVDDYFVKLAYHFGYGENLTKRWTRKQRVMFGGLVDTYQIVNNAFGDYVNGSNYYASVNEERMRAMAENTKKSFNKIEDTVTETFTGATSQVEAKTKMIGNMIIREDWCVDPMYKAMWETADVLRSKGITSEFSQNAVKLMGGIANDISSSKGNIQRAYNSALTPTGNTIVDIGVGIAEQIKQGMLDGAGFAKQGAEGMTKGMAQAFNVFGEKVYDYFMEIGNLGKTVLGGTGLQFGTATFNNTYKVPKVKGYATGGFPDSADFFYANENGVPEYVGTLGGRTAVATNTDIVKGVSDGVYRAIASTGIQNDVKKIASKNGNVVFAPSAEAGKVMQQSVNLYNGTGGRY